MKINGRSVAAAQATLMATAIVDAVASAEVCGGCASNATLTANRTSQEILTAVAEAEIQLVERTNGGTRDVVVEEFVEMVVEGTAKAVGQVRRSHKRPPVDTKYS